MHDPALMQIPDRIDDRTYHLPRLLLSVHRLLSDLIVQLSTRKVLQHQVDVFLVGVAIVKLDDVGVTDVAHNVDLPFQQNLLVLVHLLPESGPKYFFMILIATTFPVFFSRPRITFAKLPLCDTHRTRRLSRSTTTRICLGSLPPLINYRFYSLRNLISIISITTATISSDNSIIPYYNHTKLNKIHNILDMHTLELI